MAAEALAGDPPVAAAHLLGCLLVVGEVVARLVEVEAYGPDDPASHAHAGRRTARTEPMFGPPGTAYVYRSYGMHWCVNVACGPQGEGAAVLLRAAAVCAGLDRVRARRPNRSDEQLLRGPGNLGAGLGLTGADSGRDLLARPGPTTPGDPSAVEPWLANDGWRPDPDAVSQGPRVGVRLAADRPWRWWITGDPAVSAYRRHPQAS